MRATIYCRTLTNTCCSPYCHCCGWRIVSTAVTPSASKTSTVTCEPTLFGSRCVPQAAPISICGPLKGGRRVFRQVYGRSLELVSVRVGHLRRGSTWTCSSSLGCISPSDRQVGIRGNERLARNSDQNQSTICVYPSALLTQALRALRSLFPNALQKTHAPGTPINDESRGGDHAAAITLELLHAAGVREIQLFKD